MNYSEWATAFSESAGQWIERVVEFIPNLSAAIVFVVVGWLLARLLRAAWGGLINGLLDRLSRSAAIQRSLERTGLRRTIPAVTGAFIYWSIFLLFLIAAVDQLDLAFVTNLLGNLIAYLPQLLVGILVLFVGLLGSNLAYHAVTSGASSAGVNYASLIGRTAQVLVLLVAVVVAADQVGIQSTLLMLVIAIVLATTLGGAALAFGLGSGPAVTNIISTYYIQQMYRVGQQVRIGGIQGQIAEITPTAVVLDTQDGRVLIPARKFTEETSTLMGGEHS